MECLSISMIIESSRGFGSLLCLQGLCSPSNSAPLDDGVLSLMKHGISDRLFEARALQCKKGMTIETAPSSYCTFLSSIAAGRGHAFLPGAAGQENRCPRAWAPGSPPKVLLVLDGCESTFAAYETPLSCRTGSEEGSFQLLHELLLLVREDLLWL